ncbi:MAG TPA: hypothetical protein VIK45_17200 [Candidatus Dormibacteraeota bacterium]
MERRVSGGSLLLGVILVLIGAAYLLQQFVPQPSLGLDLGHYGWPIFVILPGVALLVLGLTVRDLSGLCIPGAIVTMTGIVLAIQNTFDLFATWAYAWALVAPGGVGLGLWLQGLVRREPSLRAAGLRTMGIGVAIFLVGAAFFEGVIHISGREFGPFGQLVLPLLLIGVGAWLLLRRALPFGRQRDSYER